MKFSMSDLFTFTKQISNEIQKQPQEVFCKKRCFMEISQNSQESTFFHRTPPVVASGNSYFCVVYDFKGATLFFTDRGQ